MLSADLRASERRLKDRATAAAEKAKQKLEKEQIIAQRRHAREQALEEERSRQRLLLEEKQRLLEEQRQRQIEHNRGVLYNASLIAVPAPDSIATSKGIKRSADKILLPPSAGRLLLDQNASKNGAYFFELESQTGRKTHAGLLEFTAAEGFIALPQKVLRCLWGPDADTEFLEDTTSNTANEAIRVKVSYRRLVKGTKAVFQPRSAEFQSTVGDTIRDVLEQALLQHSCLTVGDWISIGDKDTGRAFDLRVRELEPESAVSIIDTELEAEVYPSVETEEKILQEEMEARKRAAEAAELARREAAEETSRLEVEEERRKARSKAQKEKEESLPPEPGSGAVDVITCLFRFPDGSRYSRKFFRESSVCELFDFVDSKGASGYEFGGIGYRLVTQYPRSVVEYEQSTAAGQAIGGVLNAGEVVLFLEPR